MEGSTKKAAPLDGRGAIVTGAGGGIGKEIAKRLASDGAKVIVHYSSKSDGANQAVAEINASTGEERALAVKADIREESQVMHLFDEAERFLGGNLHIVVNNAGVMDTKYPTVANTEVEEWDRTFEVNCKGTFMCSREGARRVSKSGGGRIINVSTSIVGTLMPGYAAYAASKAAVETMTKILAKELRGCRITANCVAPGPIETEFFYAGKSPQQISAIAKSAPLERLGKPEDVAPVVAFLASDQGEWVNAQVVRANGGLV